MFLNNVSRKFRTDKTLLVLKLLFSNILCNCVITWLQLLETLHSGYFHRKYENMKGGQGKILKMNKSWFKRHQKILTYESYSIYHIHTTSSHYRGRTIPEHKGKTSHLYQTKSRQTGC